MCYFTNCMTSPAHGRDKTAWRKVGSISALVSVPSALGSPVLLCGSWRLKTWSWILGRVVGFLTKVFFILWLPPLILSALSYVFGYRITNRGLVFSNCTVVSWFAVAVVAAPNLPVQVTFGHACNSWWPTDCVVWLYISLSIPKHSRKWVEFIGLCQQLC